jgi:L-lactate dehydrogenase complex protein LldG
MADQDRIAVLSRIRAHLADRGPAREVQTRLSRPPRGTIPARARDDPAARIEQFQAMLIGQAAEIIRVQTQEAAVCAIAEALAASGLPPILRIGHDSILAALPWKSVPALELRVGPAKAEDQAGLSRAIVAAAETGTLFLVSGPDNPTSLAFLPETHFILIAAADLVGPYEEAFDRLRALYGPGRLPRSVNMISGPSRTADIEQTIVRGAHGPKRLLVLLLA